MFTPNQRPESYSLNVHFNDLSHLYFYVKGEEWKMLEDQPKMMFFTPFGDRGDIILNHFIWYSNSLLPFIDLFSRAYAFPRKKLRCEFAAVKKWRNKVGVHFSVVNPGRKRALECPKCGALIKPQRDGDSAMVQSASINQFLTWSNERFSMGREVMASPDTGDSTPDDWGWEVTEVHERVLAIIKGYN